METETIKWKDIKIGDKFVDGSKVLGLHDKVTEQCYYIEPIDYSVPSLIKWIMPNKQKLEDSTDGCIVGQDHLILCDISHLPSDIKNEIKQELGNLVIPTLLTEHLYYDNEKDMEKEKDYLIQQNQDGVKYDNLKIKYNSKTKMVVDKYDKVMVDNNTFWLTAKHIYKLTSLNFDIYSNGYKLKCKKLDKKTAFCVETDTHQYVTNKLIHHNSVMLQDIIFHCLTHGSDMALAMIDLKLTEMDMWKEHKQVKYVANSIREARELVLIVRRLMDKRNLEMQKLSVKDIMDYQPTDFTGKVEIAGRTFDVNDTVDIRTKDGEEKTVKVGELDQYLDWEDPDMEET